MGTEVGAIGFASRFLSAARTSGGSYWLPTAERAADGTYPLARNLYIYINRPSTAALTPAVRELLRFICPKQGQEIAARDGNFPLDAALATQECAID